MDTLNEEHAQDRVHSLAGKVAIVTGASRGVGRAVARLFAHDGAAVVLASRSFASLQAHVLEIAREGGRALAVTTDVADEASIQRLFDQTAAAFGPVDILVNSAGAVANVPFAQMATSEFDTVLGVNLRGTFLCCREAFRRMIPAWRRSYNQSIFAFRSAGSGKISRSQRLQYFQVRCRWSLRNHCR